ncbi:glycosyltransferase [Butyrivibrio sp. FC2001]|uniref:glycosyltransferase n=1 Tax=Butyrivibrio sp. FC2001 TaxID=1280671 RepID=UPI00040FBA01|nr:glycosyltransferase [Butyrivibrio sp. FC2001]
MSKITDIAKLPIKVVSAINPTNLSILYNAFKKGGIKQIQWELNAYKMRLGGIDEDSEIPELLDYTSHEKIEDYEKIDIPECLNPEVSIIIPVYNQFDYTYNCLKSIAQNTTSAITYEIIIADDVSTDFTTDLNSIAPNIKIVRNSENQRFLRNCNNAAKHAKGKYILFLNNDTQVQPDWLRPLVEIMENDESVGMTGSKLIYPDGKLQEAGGILWQDGSAWNYGNGQNASLSQFNYVKEADYISGAAIMIRRSLWEEIGGFDDRYAPAYYEDTDLAFEVRKHGYKVIYQPKSVVVHFEGKSNGTDTSTGLKAYQVENGKKFYEKWKEELTRNHFPNGQEVFLARDRSRNKKHILVIDHRLPHYDKDAGGRCTYMYLLQFARMGLQVTFLTDPFLPEEPYKSALEKEGIEVLYGNFMRNNWELWLYENGRYFDYVYLQRPDITMKYLGAVKKHCKCKLIYFAHDLYHIREHREYEVTGDAKHLEKSRKMKEIEFKIFDSVDVIHVVGSYEQHYLQKKLPNSSIRNIPLYIYEEEQNDIPKDFSKRQDIIFVGGFGHRPNVDAVKWFVRDIFPQILEEYPDMKIHIVGGNPPEEVQQLASDHIILEGFVSDEKLVQLYKQCRLAVVPLRFGAGVKGKIVEAAYYQIPMVTTPIGAEGMSTKENTMIVAETAREFADEVCKLYKDMDRLREMSDNGKAFIKKYFSLEAAKSVIEQDITP